MSRWFGLVGALWVVSFILFRMGGSSFFIKWEVGGPYFCWCGTGPIIRGECLSVGLKLCVPVVWHGGRFKFETCNMPRTCVRGIFTCVIGLLRHWCGATYQ